MSARTRWGRLAVFAAVLVSGAACDGDDPAGPESGTLEVRLATPFADDGALVVRVTGPDVGSDAAVNPDGDGLAPVDPGLYSHAVGSTGGVTVVLVGDLTAGSLIRFPVSDVGAVAEYAGTVLQAADRSNALRESVDGYSLTVARVGGQ